MRIVWVVGGLCGFASTMVTIAGRNILFGACNARSSSHAGSRFLHIQIQQDEEKRAQKWSQKSGLRSESAAASDSAQLIYRRARSKARPEHLQKHRHADIQKQRFDKFATLVELLLAVEKESGHHSTSQVNTMRNNTSPTLALDKLASDYLVGIERLFSLLRYHQEFVHLLQGALLDAPRHLRLRKFVLGFLTSSKVIAAETGNLKHVFGLIRRHAVKTDTFAVETLAYKCESRWEKSIGAVVATNIHIMEFLDTTPEYRFTGIFRTQAFTMQGLYMNSRYHRQEYTAFFARRSQLTNTAAIHIVMRQMIRDTELCHPIQKDIAKWARENMRGRRFAAATLKQLRYALDAYNGCLVSLRKELQEPWIPSLLQFLELKPAHELACKRAVVSRYWLRRIQHQKAYEAAMTPIRAKLEYLRRMKSSLRRQRGNAMKRGRQGYQNLEARKTNGVLPEGSSTFTTSANALMPLSGTSRHTSPHSLTTSSGRRYSTATLQKCPPEDFSYIWQDHKKLRVLRVKLSKGRSAWKNCIQQLKLDEEATSSLPLSAQRATQLEQEYANANVSHQPVAEMKLNNARNSLRIMQQVQPIYQHMSSMNCLTSILRATPFYRLRTFYWVFTYFTNMISKDVRAYETLCRASTDQHPIVRQFRGLVLPLHCVTKYDNNTHGLWALIEQEMIYPSKSYGMRLRAAFTKFQVHARTFSTFNKAVVKALTAIKLRRAPSSRRQHVFHAVQHQHREVYSSRRMFHEFFLRNIKVLIAFTTRLRQRGRPSNEL